MTDWKHAPLLVWAYFLALEFIDDRMRTQSDFVNQPAWSFVPVSHPSIMTLVVFAVR